ncbi:tRNA/rRNA methyltransferase [Roseimarinus sediminis]|uniref:tRNA/rRNA methyltransferase n=1 Tax=Roseimarinus sediminis TaxID=1610899 RepID=UPI003D1A5E18
MIFNFLLVEPASPANVGAAARAIKTMGFKHLRLINPCDYLCDEARWLAHASNDILESATVYGSLEEATADLDFVVGTTAKQRSVKEDYLPLKLLKPSIDSKSGSINKLGIVFGREDSGLRNHELKRCDLVSTVPLVKPYPSLNLAQAVMLYAYELSTIQQAETINLQSEAASFQQLKKKIERLLHQIGMKEESNIFPRIIERLNLLSDTDVHLLHSISNKILENSEK